MKKIVLKFKTMLEYQDYLQHNDVTVISKGCANGVWYVVLKGKEETMKLFGNIGDFVDGVLGKAATKAVKTAVKVYETKTPAVSFETLVDAGAEKVKIAATVGKKFLNNGKAKLQAMKDANLKKRKMLNQGPTENFGQ